MELENVLAERYSLDPTKKWKIIDRSDNLVLLDGFYQGTILELDNTGGNGYHDFYTFSVKEISDQTVLRELSGKTLYTFPDGILYKVWTYQGQRMYSTKNKIHNPLIFQYLFDEEIAEGYYIVSGEGLSLTYRQSLSGVFRILDGVELPLVEIEEAVRWLGTDDKSSNGEMIYAVDGSNNITIYKPPSKKWRESVVYSKSYSDRILFGLEVKEDLLTRWINLSTSAKLTEEEYKKFWILFSPDVSTPHNRLINTYSCFLNSLYIGHISIYEDWYNVNFPNKYDPQNVDFSQLKVTDKPSNLNELILHIWKLIEEDTDIKVIRRLKRVVDNSLSDPWTAYLNLFLPDGLDGYEINRLRKL